MPRVDAVAGAPRTRPKRPCLAARRPTTTTALPAKRGVAEPQDRRVEIVRVDVKNLPLHRAPPARPAGSEPSLDYPDHHPQHLAPSRPSHRHRVSAPPAPHERELSGRGPAADLEKKAIPLPHLAAAARTRSSRSTLRYVIAIPRRRPRCDSRSSPSTATVRTDPAGTRRTSPDDDAAHLDLGRRHDDVLHRRVRGPEPHRRRPRGRTASSSPRRRAGARPSSAPFSTRRRFSTTMRSPSRIPSPVIDSPFTRSAKVSPRPARSGGQSDALRAPRSPRSASPPRPPRRAAPRAPRAAASGSIERALFQPRRRTPFRLMFARCSCTVLTAESLKCAAISSRDGAYPFAA